MFNIKVFRFKHKLGEDYWEVLDYIDTHGQFYTNERGQTYKEADPIVIIVDDPHFGMPSEVLPEYIIQRWGEQFIFEYANRVAWGLPEPGQWSYSYGERLGQQVENVIVKLKKHPETRQATCVLYRPEDTISPEPPCLCVVDFKIRKGLHTYGILRSNDMENAYPSNYYDLLMLSHRVCETLGVRLKRIVTFSISAHIYRRKR